MARPLSEEKRDALIAAATELVAAQGVGATTAKIAKRAGLSEGTLFTYFATKEELFNQLFMELETELAHTLLEGYPQKDAIGQDRVRYLWNQFIDWGAAYPNKLKALKQLKVSDRLDEACRKFGEEVFGAMKAELKQSMEPHLRPGQTMGYLHAVFAALAETTLDFIARYPEQAKQYKQVGFDVFWHGLTC